MSEGPSEDPTATATTMVSLLLLSLILLFFVIIIVIIIVNIIVNIMMIARILSCARASAGELCYVPQAGSLNRECSILRVWTKTRRFKS